MKIIIAIKKPAKDQPNALRQWSLTVEALQIQLTPLEAASIQPLGEGAWLILSENGLSFLSRALAAAEGDKLPINFSSRKTRSPGNRITRSTRIYPQRFQGHLFLELLD